MHLFFVSPGDSLTQIRAAILLFSNSGNPNSPSSPWCGPPIQCLCDARTMLHCRHSTCQMCAKFWLRWWRMVNVLQGRKQNSSQVHTLSNQILDGEFRKIEDLGRIEGGTEATRIGSWHKIWMQAGEQIRLTDEVQNLLLGNFHAPKMLS